MVEDHAVTRRAQREIVSVLVARTAARSATEAHRIATCYADAGLRPAAHSTHWYRFDTVRAGRPGTFRTVKPSPTVRIRIAENIGPRPTAADNAEQNLDRAAILAAVRRLRDIIKTK